MPKQERRGRPGLAPAWLAMLALSAGALAGAQATARAQPAEPAPGPPETAAEQLRRGALPTDAAEDPSEAADLSDLDGEEPTDRPDDDAAEPPPEPALRPAIDPYEPLGVRVGSFLLFPSIETGALHTDNVLLSGTNPQSDSAYTVAPGLRFRSNWSRHELSGEVSAYRSYFERFDSEDDRRHDARLRGRLDVTRRTSLEAEGTHGLTQESRDSSDFPTGAEGRADIRTDRLSLQGSHSINRVTLRLRGQVTDETYGEVPLADGDISDNSDRDNAKNELIARTAYEFRPGVSVFVEGAVNERRFKRALDRNGLRRDSTGWTAQVGLAMALTGKLEGEAAVGYAEQTPDDAAQTAIDGVVFDAGLTWRPTALTTVRFAAASEIDETTIANESGSVLRSYELAVEHALRRNIVLGAALAYGTETFAGAGDDTRDWGAALSAEYRLNRSVAIEGEYSYTEELPTGDSDGYDENRVRVGVALRR